MSAVQPPRDRRRLWLALGALLVLVAAGVVVAVLLTRGGGDSAESGPTATGGPTTTAVTNTTAVTSTESTPTQATAVVPSVVGLQQRAATARIEQLGLHALARSQAGSQPSGVVVGQNPAAGSRVPDGALVGLVVSNGPEGVVPRVIGLSAAQAAAKLRSVGLGSRARSVASERRPGTVIAQSPAAGTHLARGEVVLAVSRGAPKVQVPKVVGLPRATAVSRLRTAGFPARIRLARSSEPAGTVLDQVPVAGSVAERGRPVHLTVSRENAPAGTVLVPGVIDLQQEAAEKRLRAAGLVPRAVGVHSLALVGTVIAQDPAAGARAARGSRVTIRISTGPGP